LRAQGCPFFSAGNFCRLFVRPKTGLADFPRSLSDCCLFVRTGEKGAPGGAAAGSVGGLPGRPLGPGRAGGVPNTNTDHPRDRAGPCQVRRRFFSGARVWLGSGRKTSTLQRGEKSKKFEVHLHHGLACPDGRSPPPFSTKTKPTVRTRLKKRWVGACDWACSNVGKPTTVLLLSVRGWRGRGGTPLQ